MRRRHLGAPRGIAPLSRSRRPDQAGVSPRPVYPAAARCTWPGVNVASHAHGDRIPAQPSHATRSNAPPGGLNAWNIGPPSQLVKPDSRKMIIFMAHKRGLFQRRKKSAPAARGADFSVVAWAAKPGAGFASVAAVPDFAALNPGYVP